jgi:VWA-like domain (DUF2201)
MSKKSKFILPDSPVDFLNDLIDAYPEEDRPTLNKIIGIGKIKYQDEDLIPGMPMTAAVMNTRPYTLLFGKKFMEEKMDSVEDAIYVVSHELTHLVLDHFAKDIIEEFKEKDLGFQASHIIVDCQVNATVCNSFSDPKYVEFPKKFYEKDVVPYCFFRPDGVPVYNFNGYTPEAIERMKAAKEAKKEYTITREDKILTPLAADMQISLVELHKKLYSTAGITNKELIEGLMPWFEGKDQETLDQVVNQLLGNHKDTFKDRGMDEDNPELSDLAQGVAESYLKKNQKKMEDALDKAEEEGGDKEQPGGKQASKGGEPRTKTIQKFADDLEYVNNVKGKFKKKEVISPSSRIYKAIADYLPKTSIRTVIPNFHDRRTTSVYAKTKRTPIFHQTPKIGSRVIVPCYLDVSGSQDHVIPHTSKAVILLKKEIGNVVYCFSTVVSETPISTLERGDYTTTGGTDFNPVIEHILKKRFKQAVILTDGQAWLNDELIEAVKRNNIKITVVWTDMNPTKDPLQKIADKELYLFDKESYNREVNKIGV